MNSEQPARVSIALCTYNGEKYLLEQLESLSDQELQPYEVIVGDDGSSDNTIQIIKTFSESVSFPVKITINSQTLGFAENFIRTAYRCDGDYIAFCDQDDIWLPDKLLRCSEILEQNRDIMLVFHSFDIVDKELSMIKENSSDKDIIYEPRSLGLWGYFYGFSEFFRTELLNLVDLDDLLKKDLSIQRGVLIEPMAHDVWVYFLSLSLSRTYHISSTLAMYRQHGSNSIGFVEKQNLYGLWPKLVMLLQKFWTRSNGPYYRTLAEIAARRVQILKKVSERTNSLSIMHNNAKISIDLWVEAERTYRIRTNIYEKGNIIKRILSIYNAICSKAYRAPYASGWKSALKDVLSLFYLQK